MNSEAANGPAYLGILVTAKRGSGAPFSSRAFYRRLDAAARSRGFATYVFAPEWIDWERKQIRGYAYDESSGEWTRGRFPFPRVVYDRAFFRTKAELDRHRALLRRLTAERGVELLGLCLGGKLEVHRLLAKDPETAALLPATARYTGPGALARWLRERGEAVLKPNGSSHGRGVFRLRRIGPDAYEARGRTRANRPAAYRFGSLNALLRWVDRRLVADSRFLVQAYLTLTANDGAPYDIRALVQKDGEGRWRLTGAAARVGAVGGLTSNLHGGGTSREAADFLLEQFGEAEAERILESIRAASMAVPRVLERWHGPLLELGIDFGVDRRGRVWLLEVNSKPGRMSFARLHDQSVRIAAVTSPIRYARYVLDRQLGGQINEFDGKQDSFYEKNG
ncbi:YheC/YheD family protein [Paenibacillus sp.]|uniref:YheC/YheD family endospore coat-associated protein n=1 Tax=Paenibacillus sp. TaxID=58172 RepID=UPI002D60C933|nr:YheC/YheD family protein [Paenibacillus sp.]HZG83596.1 YheC/YheD family protein [Paenibacillus sp.]